MTKVTPVPFAPTRISVKDFGPIKEADVHLGKVTVLMGPNNTGKSYFTLLIPALSELVREWRFAWPLMAPPRFEPEEFMRYLEMKFGNIICRLYAVNRPENLIRRGSEKAQLKFELIELMPEGEGEQVGDVLELEVQIEKKSGIISRFGGSSELFEGNKVPKSNRFSFRQRGQGSCARIGNFYVYMWRRVGLEHRHRRGGLCN